MAPTSTKRGRPAVVSVGEIVDAAVGLIDARGLGALTMRTLAQTMGVAPMTIYRHVANKQALLTMIPDALLAGVCNDVLRKRTGLSALRTIGQGLAAVLERHPGSARLFESPARGPNMDAAAAHTVRLLTIEGLSTTEATVALRAMVAQVIGEGITRHGRFDFRGVQLVLDGVRLRLDARAGA
jgi:AcrR family transcriptional regulator